MRRIRYMAVILLLILVFTACGDKARVYMGTAAAGESASETGAAGEPEDGIEDGAAEDTKEPLTETAAEADKLACYVCGAVESPGVYYLDKDMRKQDAVLAAGGFAAGAAESYVNLAEKLTDGEKIYIPTEDELETGKLSGDPLSGLHEVSENGLVDLNKAGKDELMTLPGIGESKADSIIAYRDEHGGFSSPEEILKVQGIKDGVYNKIKDKIKAD